MDSQVDKAELDRQVDQIVRAVLSSAPQPTAILRYLVTQSDPVKETLVAREALDLNDDNAESKVRTYMDRLRDKLELYYKYHVSIPPTHGRGYALKVSRLEDLARQEPGAPAPDDRAEIPPSTGGRSRFREKSHWLAAGGVGAALALAVALLLSHSPNRPPAPLPPAVSVFWQNVLDPSIEPLVVFANAKFIGDPLNGMRLPHAEESKATFDYYTGIGEAFGINELDDVFFRMKRNYLLRASQRTRFGEAIVNDKKRDVVLIGSSSANPLVKGIPDRDFRFLHALPEGTCIQDLSEAKKPKCASDLFATTEDFALVQYYVTAPQARSILLLAGNTTLGTQAAVNFVCEPGHLTELIAQLQGGVQGLKRDFSVLLRVKVFDREVNGIHIEDVRPRALSKAAR